MASKAEPAETRVIILIERDGKRLREVSGQGVDVAKTIDRVAKQAKAEHADTEPA